MRPPGRMYLAALFSKLASTCASRTTSPSTSNGSGGCPTVNAWLRASINGRAVSTARATMVRSSTGSLRSSILPRVMRDTSSRSSTNRAMTCT